MFFETPLLQMVIKVKIEACCGQEKDHISNLYPEISWFVFYLEVFWLKGNLHLGTQGVCQWVKVSDIKKCLKAASFQATFLLLLTVTEPLLAANFLI